MALCIYILVAYLRTQERSIEAGLKYFLLGAFSSGILLYGISLLLAPPVRTNQSIPATNDEVGPRSSTSNLLVFAGALMVAGGFAFGVAGCALPRM